MKCDKLTSPIKIEIPGLGTIESNDLLLKSEVVAVIDKLKQKIHDAEMAKDDAEAANTEYREDIRKLKADNERLKDKLRHYPVMTALLDSDKEELRYMRRSLWIMTAEWADAMGLASCNIANKFMSRENFEVGDDYRNKTIKKYRHRQVVFYKYAEYCRKKAEEYK